MSEQATLVEVTQADREAAADYYAIPCIGEYENEISERVRQGLHEDPLLRALARHRIAATRPNADGLVEALEQARRDIVNLVVSGTDRIDELCKKLQKMDPSPIWPIPFPDPPERTWQPIVRQIDAALSAFQQETDRG